jgi:hypothetical protein
VPPDPAIFGAVLAGVTVHAGTVMRY